eukprot:TRINITY_DN24103_c0_g1_i2.p5 TRINITY_DN24103_c0_g1~~TRINITY_DN24103_c0_g1_i2.p5  ORF type:complete len:124 (+),score=1.65 TRINITY_DN24103_c0_g1_i2:286-657(+)
MPQNSVCSRAAYLEVGTQIINLIQFCFTSSAHIKQFGGSYVLVDKYLLVDSILYFIFQQLVQYRGSVKLIFGVAGGSVLIVIFVQQVLYSTNSQFSYILCFYVLGQTLEHFYKILRCTCRHAS